MLKKLIEQAVRMQLYVGEEGAPAGGDGGAVSVEAPAEAPVEVVASPTDVPQDFMDSVLENDPEYREILAQQKKSEDDSEKPVEDSDEPTTTVEGDEDDGDYADDVIPGLKGKTIAALPVEEQEALAEYYEKAEAAKKGVEAAQAQAKLLEDPIIKHRLAMLAGQAGDFPVRGLSNAELAAIADKHGFTMDEVKVMAPDIERIAKEMAADMSRNMTAQELRQQKAAEVTTKGRQMLLGLSKFNAQLASDISADDVQDIIIKGEAHPKWKQWEQGAGRIYNWARQKGFTYADLTARFSEKSLYAAAAADLDLPVAMNTKGRDSKLRADAVRAKLKPFFKGGARTLDSQAGEAASVARSTGLMHNGYDAIKLASDENYLDNHLSKIGHDPEKRAKLLEAADKGRKALTKKK